MIVLTVESFNGLPTEARSVSFDELGGTIGRAETNQLVLPDPERSVSRVHARIVYRNGGFAIIDQGANPVMVNGQPAGTGTEVPLQHGDSLEVGGYRIAVSFGHKPQQVADPFSDLFGTPETQVRGETAGARPPAAPTRSPTGAPSAIPDDWNMFDERTGASTAPNFEDDIGVPLQEESLDDMFKLGPGNSDLGLLEPTVPPGTRIPAPMRDHGSDLRTPWPSARPKPSAGPVLSWQEGAREKQVVVPEGGRPPGAPNREPMEPPARPERGPAPHETVQAGPPEAADASALLRALLDGLGMAQVQPEALHEDFMRNLGVVLREATEGTVHLLQGRTAFKRELRAEVTTITPRENNPLKFSPDVETALRHLLQPTSRGFMKPEAAMRDAYDDLRAHQIALMAGIRAALDGLLARFNPEALESRVAPRGAFASLLPSGRKAQLWEQFGEQYDKICKEAADGFYDLFGTSFLKAYQAEIERLNNAKPEDTC
jgi:type VI secretion system FHA domain protein